MFVRLGHQTGVVDGGLLENLNGAGHFADFVRSRYSGNRRKSSPLHDLPERLFQSFETAQNLHVDEKCEERVAYSHQSNRDESECHGQIRRIPGGLDLARCPVFQKHEEIVDGLHDLGLVVVIQGRVEHIDRLLAIGGGLRRRGLGFHEIHRIDLKAHQSVGIVFGLLQLCEFFVRESRLLHEIQKRRRLARRSGLSHAVCDKIPIDPVVVLGSGRLAIPNVEDFHVGVFVGDIACHHIGPPQTRKIIRTLAQFRSQEVRLMPSFLDGRQRLVRRRLKPDRSAKNQKSQNVYRDQDLKRAGDGNIAHG